MKRLNLAIAGMLAAGFWGNPAMAEPEICKVVLTSTEAGGLEVVKTILPPDAESLVHTAGSIYSIWSPSTSGNSANVRLHYSASDQDKGVGDLDGIWIEFPQTEGMAANQFSAQIVADDMMPLSLNKAADIAGTDRFGFILDGRRPDDRAMGRLLSQGAHVKVVIFRADWVLQPEMFEGTQMSLNVLGEPRAIISEEVDTTAIAARDKLFAQAKSAVVAHDPKICSPLL